MFSGFQADQGERREGSWNKAGDVERKGVTTHVSEKRQGQTSYQVEWAVSLDLDYYIQMDESILQVTLNGHYQQNDS